MSSYVFLTECSDIAEAGVIKSFLESQGFHPKIRDEQMRTVAPHLQNLLGKLLIEVPEFEFLSASQALEELEHENSLKLVSTDPDTTAPDSDLLHTQSLAKKALINSVLGCIFIPLVCNLYSMILGWRVLRQERPLTAVSGKRLMLAILFNSIAFYVWLTFGTKYFLHNL